LRALERVRYLAPVERNAVNGDQRIIRCRLGFGRLSHCENCTRAAAPDDNALHAYR
jgi:hypothetical protein